MENSSPHLLVENQNLMTKIDNLEKKVDQLLHVMNQQIDPDELKTFKLQQEQANLLFRMIGIMLPLFFPVFLSLQSYVSVMAYNMLIVGQWFFFGSFIILMIGFLWKPQLPIEWKTVSHWRYVFIYLPMICFTIGIVCMIFVFSEKEESDIWARVVTGVFMIVAFLILFPSLKWLLKKMSTK